MDNVKFYHLQARVKQLTVHDRLLSKKLGRARVKALKHRAIINMLRKKLSLTLEEVILLARKEGIC